MVNNNPQLTAANAKAKSKAKVINKDLNRKVEQLPFPKPGNDGWKGRCYRCLAVDHIRANCTAKVAFCANCQKEGHETSKCKTVSKVKETQIDPLEPRGNVGDDLMPVTRPQSISVIVPQTRGSYRDLRYLQRAVIVDARLWPSHDPAGVQARLMAVCMVEEPFELSELDGDRYVLIIPNNMDRRQFLRMHTAKLEDLSLVCYPWSPRIGTEPVVYPFKVWVDLYKVPLTAWNFEYLVPLLAQVGLILDHTPFEKVQSLRKLRVVLAVKNLAKVPHAIDFAVRGLGTDVMVKVVGWDYQETTVKVPDDPTPSAAYFQGVQCRLLNHPLIAVQPDTSATTVPVNVDAIFKWWEKLQDDEQKTSLEKMLRTSPFWAVKEKLDFLKGKPTVELVLSDFGDVNSNPKKQGKIGAVIRGSSSSTNPLAQAMENLPFEGGATPDSPHQIRSTEIQNNEGQINSHPTVAAVLPLLQTKRGGKSNMCSGNKETRDQGLIMEESSSKFENLEKETALVREGLSPNSKLACLLAKRPADEQNEPKSKRHVERQLNFSPNRLENTERTTNDLNMGVTKIKGPKVTSATFSLRRSSRVIKDSTKLKSFVTGNKKLATRKGSVGKIKPDVVKAALEGAKLLKCLNSEAVNAEPLTNEEINRIKTFCSIIPIDAEVIMEEPEIGIEQQEVNPEIEVEQQVVVPETQPEDVCTEELGESVLSGLDEWVQNEYSGDDDEANLE